MPAGDADYDVIVVGLGAMGAAATWQLARTGARTLGIDQYRPPHSLGSTHGDTRITRLAVGEGPAYVPLVRRSHELWRTLEAETGRSLFAVTGGLVVGSGRPQTPGRSFLTSTVAVARAFGIEHEELGTADLRRRFPPLLVGEDEQGYFEPSAGIVRPEAAVRAELQLAERSGAHLRTEERVLGFESRSDHVRVRTDQGSYRAETLIMAAGPWTQTLLPDRADLFGVFRQVLYWFELDGPDSYQEYRRMPVFIWPVDGARGLGLYGFPALDGPRGGVKLATEQYTAPCSPEKVQRSVSDHEVAEMYRELVSGRLRGLRPRCVRTRTCLYTVTPDHHFVIDRHPRHRNVIVASPCSGHGFKHSAAIGEIVSQLATRGDSDLDIGPFSFARASLTA